MSKSRKSGGKADQPRFRYRAVGEWAGMSTEAIDAQIAAAAAGQPDDGPQPDSAMGRRLRACRARRWLSEEVWKTR